MKRPTRETLPVIVPAVGVLVALLTLPSCSNWPFGESDKKTSKATTKATRGPLTITVTESGTVWADKRINILNGLEYWVNIVWAAEEGTIVKKGDRIIEFECKVLKDVIEGRERAVENQKLALEQARKQLVIQKKQAVSSLTQAENGVKAATENLAVYELLSQSALAKAKDKVARAKGTLNRYIEKGGVWDNALRDADIAILRNRKRVAIERERLDFKMEINGNPALDSPYSKTEIEGHAMLVTQMENTLQKSIRKKELLIEYDHPNTKRQLEEALAQAETDLAILVEFTIPQTFRIKRAVLAEANLNLEKTRTQQEATRAWKEFELRGKEAILKKGEEKLKELLEESDKLTVAATVDGLILHRPGWLPGGTRPIELKKGERLYPKAKLMEIPDMNTLMIKTELLDSLNIHLRRGSTGQKGTEVTFTLDAMPGREFKGHVLKTSPLAKDTGTHWMRAGISAYDVYVEVDWKAAGLIPGQNLIPGMSCSVTMHLVNIEDTLSIPVVSLYSRDNVYYCRKMVGGTDIEQQITIGMRNESRVEILDGLEEGDEILLVSDEESETMTGPLDADSLDGTAGEGGE